jgi:hypothetical protein
MTKIVQIRNIATESRQRESSAARKTIDKCDL